MLNFFKKSGRQNDGKMPHFKENRKRSIVENESNNIILDESLVKHIEDRETRSRLSKNLQEIISDKNCLIYFVQFLDLKKCIPLIKFYLDTENFRAAAELCSSSSSKTYTRSIENGTNLVAESNRNDDGRSIVSDDLSSPTFNNFVRRSMSSEGYDSISFTSYDVCDRVSLSSHSENNLRYDMTEQSSDNVNKLVPELKTLCDLSMRKPLTDDEKSRICAETAKRNVTQLPLNEKPDKPRKSIAAYAIRIYKKYLSTYSQSYIDIPVTILSNISLSLCSQQSDEDSDITTIPTDCFEEARKFVFNRLEKEFLNEFLESTFYCKYCVELLTNGTLKIADILYSEAALFYFMEYLEQENSRDYLEFWMAATNFQKHYSEVVENNFGGFNKKEAQQDAMILYEKYFSLQALCPLRLCDSVRSKVEELICTECVKVVRCFDLPINIIENYLNERHFESFLQSQLYGSYVNELRSKIKDHSTPKWDSLRKKRQHRKTYSDCTNESTKLWRNSTISQQNTLLAMESVKQKSNKSANTTNNSSSNKVTDMQIDSRQLTNPDLLWHRNSTGGGLTFGRVDALGRYERDFEYEICEDKWSLASGSSKIKNVVRKLVNLPEDKVQEEIAWQVAETIVKDITSITLKNYQDKASG